MRIALIGQAAFGERVLSALADAGEEVTVAYMPPDGGRPNPFREAAEGRGIAVRQPARMRDPEVFDEYLTFAADLNVMAFVTDIVPLTILGHPPLGTIQYHPSLLPRHRGASAINWAIINGEPKTGLTIFWPDEGLDTGPILLQREVGIEPDDTLGTVYFKKLFDLGVEAMLEAVQMVKAGTAPRIVQDLCQGEYEPVCKRMVIDWSYPIGVVYNVIRGCNSSPGAVTTYDNQELKVFDCERRFESGSQAPGTVLDVTADGFLVLGCGGSVFVKRVQPSGSGKVPAGEFAVAAGLKVGDRLG